MTAPGQPLVQLSGASTGSHIRTLKHPWFSANPDHLVAPRPDADQADRDAGEVGDEVEVGARLGRQVCFAAAGGQVWLEAGQLLLLGPRRGETALVGGEVSQD